MSTSSHSPAAPSAVGNGNASADGEINPPITSVNHSPVGNGNVSADGKNKPLLRPFPATTSVACSNDKVSDKGKEPFNEANEAGPSDIDGSSLYSSIRTSPQCSYSDVVLQRCPIRNGKPALPSTNVSSSLGLPNGPRPNGPRRRQGGYGHEMMTNSYQGLRGMAPHMQQPPEQIRPFSVPLTSPPMYPVPFNGNYVPSFWPTFQGPVRLPYVPFDGYLYPTHPQARYFSGPTYVVASPEIDAAQPQQSNFSSSFDDLRARLRKQIDYYFSSENLRTDYYLKKLMDDHGWVSVTLIMKFRKVVALLKEKDIKMQSASISDVLQVQDRSLSNDQQFVLDSVRPSDVVEVEGDTMRKRHEWEKWVLIPP